MIFVLLVTGLAPILFMFAKSFSYEGHISLFHYSEVFSSTHQWRLIGNSILLSFLVTLVTAITGIPLGVLFGKTNLPFRNLLLLLFTLPLVLPPFLLAVGWFHVAGREGLLGRHLPEGLSSTLNSLLFGFPGCVLVLSAVFLPIVMLLTIAFLKTVPPNLEEAARLTAGWPSVLMHISLPLIRPGLIFALSLVFLLSLGEVTVPMFLRYDVFAVASLTRFAAFYDFGAATAAAAPLCLLALLVIFVEKTNLQKKSDLADATYTGDCFQIDLKSNGFRILWPVSLLCFCLILAPLLAILFRSASVSNYVEAFRRVNDSLFRTLFQAAAGASILVLLGFLTGYLVQRRRFRIWPWIDSFTLFLFALPGPVIATGLISMWNRPAGRWIYGSPLMILLGYSAQYIALTSRISAASLARIPQSMEEAAQMAGADWLRRTTSIIVPLAAPGLLTGWLVAYIFCLKETAITMMIYPPGRDTFTVRIFTLMANSPAELIASCCVLMMLITILPLLLLVPLLRRQGR